MAEANLYTVCENTSGRTRLFGYLGAQGMRLEPGEVVTIPGDLIGTLPDENMRFFQSLERDLQNKAIIVRSRPSPVLFDQLDEEPCVLSVNNGALGGCLWQSSSSVSCETVAAQELLTLNEDIVGNSWGTAAVLADEGNGDVTIGDGLAGTESVFGTTNPVLACNPSSITKVTVRVKAMSDNGNTSFDVRLRIGGVLTGYEFHIWSSTDGEQIREYTFTGNWSREDFDDLHVHLNPVAMTGGTLFTVDYAQVTIHGDVTIASSSSSSSSATPASISSSSAGIPSPSSSSSVSASNSSSSLAPSSSSSLVPSSSSSAVSYSSSCFLTSVSEFLSVNQDINDSWGTWSTLSTDNGITVTVDNDDDNDEAIFGTWPLGQSYDSGDGITQVKVRIEAEAIEDEYEFDVRVSIGGVWTSMTRVSFADSDGEKVEIVTFNGTWGPEDFDNFQISVTARSGSHSSEALIDYIEAEIIGHSTTCEQVVIGGGGGAGQQPESSESGSSLSGDALFAFFYGSSSLSDQDTKNFGTIVNSLSAEFDIENAGEAPLTITEIRIDEDV